METGEGLLRDSDDVLRDADEAPEPEVPKGPPPEKPHIRDCRCLRCRKERIP